MMRFRQLPKPSSAVGWLGFLMLLLAGVVSVVAAFGSLAILVVVLTGEEAPFDIPALWFAVIGAIAAGYNVWFSHRHSWFFDSIPSWLDH